MWVTLTFEAAESYGGKERLLSSSTKYFCIKLFVPCTERYFSLPHIYIYVCVCVCVRVCMCVYVQHVRSYFPDQGSNSHPLHWEYRVSTTGPPVSPPLFLIQSFSDLYFFALLTKDSRFDTMKVISRTIRYWYMFFKKYCLYFR